MQTYQSEGCGLSIGRILSAAIPPFSPQLHSNKPLFLGYLSVLLEDTLYVTLLLIIFLLSGQNGLTVRRESRLADGANGTS